MNHPTPEAVREVADRLEQAANLYEPVIDMSIPTVAAVCGTPCCHAGLYALALRKHWPDGALSACYERGTRWMAQDLGFQSSSGLRMWARNNPKIWGNTMGSSMFVSKLAFVPVSDPITVNTIVAHWRAVADRLEGVAHGTSDA